MEDKSPTMPYMLLRNFGVHQTRSTSQGQISECEYFAPNPVECPRCEARDVVFYDHYERRANFLLKGGEKRLLIIKAKRYKCPHCGRVFRETIEGLKPWHRSSTELRKLIAERYRQGVCNKNIAAEFHVSESTVERIIHERYDAKIVADRFHVIKLVLSTFMDFCRDMQPNIKWKRPITGTLRTHAANLKDETKPMLQAFLAENPIIASAYDFKERLCKLLNNKKKTRKQCLLLIRELKHYMELMRTESTHHFHTLAETLSKWFEPIIRMWRFSKNNGITERFHRKIKGIQRRGYGYRNFENYKLRVLVECSHGR